MSAPHTHPAPSLGSGAGRVRTLAVLAVAVVVIAVAAVLIGQPTAGQTVQTDAKAGAPVVGQVPPAFTATTVDGASVTPASFAGKPLWLTIGASWCPDCRAEAAELQEVYATYQPKGLAILSVFDQEDATVVKDFGARVGFTFSLVPDPSGAIRNQYRALGIPTHYFIGADGTIKAIRVGRLPKPDMEALVTSILPASN